MSVRDYITGMRTTVEKIMSEALGLPPQTRAFVAEKLIESIDAAPSGKLSVAWRKEIRRRRREMDEGAVLLRDAKAVFANAFAALK